MKVLIKEVIDQGVLLGRAVGGRGAMGSTDKSRFFFFFFKCVSLSLTFWLQNRVLQHSRLLIHHQFLSTFRIQNGIVAFNKGSFPIKELYLPEVS